MKVLRINKIKREALCIGQLINTGNFKLHENCIKKYKD